MFFLALIAFLYNSVHSFSVYPACLQTCVFSDLYTSPATRFQMRIYFRFLFLNNIHSIINPIQCNAVQIQNCFTVHNTASTENVFRSIAARS